MMAERKRNPRGAGSYWQRQSDGMWIGAIDVGYVNGKRRRKRVYAKTQRECVRKLDDAKAAIRRGDLTTSSMRTDVWLRYWLEEIAALKVKPRTLQDYRSKVETYLIPQLGKTRLDKLTPVHVRGLHKWMRENKKSETTITHTHWLLVGSLRAAMTEVGLANNVARNVDAPVKAKNEGRALTPEECRRVLDAAGEDRARWVFALYTGTRQGEALGLQWDRVDLDNAYADISWALQRIPYAHGCLVNDKSTCGKRPHGCPKKYLRVPPGMEWQQLERNLCLVRPKTARSVRYVDLTPGVVHALRELQARDSGPNPHGLVWHREDGRPVDGRADYREWIALQGKAKIEDPIPLHGTRHTSASVMHAAGIPEPVIMQVLGHSLASTTRGYTHADRTLTRAAMLAIEAAVEG